ncbi:MAG: hypothetical protein IH847_11320, partial [Acidobacteria bacterium]|nr:hypothetical protein [Acidobacteriota bacterium]
MRAPAYWRFLLVALLAGVFFFGLSGQRAAHAGGPLIVGGTFGVDAQPFTWDTSAPINYTTDGGMLGSLTAAQADTRVASMFQVWADVSTATISFSRSGSIMNAGVFTDGDVDTMEEFDAVERSCAVDGIQSPIVFDADGSIFQDLFGDPNVIGFAGPCRFDSSGRILTAEAALNGRFLDGITDLNATPPNFELTDNEFDAAFIHEFGHFSGLDHSQINVNCLGGGCPDFSDDAFGLPTMFPFLLSGLEESNGVPAQLTLAPDDVAWISRLYPATGAGGFDATFGTIEGTIFFSDGQTPAQGVNVIARQVEDGNPANGDESRRVAVSVVSGYLFTGNPAQSVTGTNPGSSFGSRTPTLIGFYRIPGLLPGNYTIEVESINEGFDAGSSVGPLNPPIPMPGTAPSPAGPFVVSAGGTVIGGTNIPLVGTPPRFDQFE